MNTSKSGIILECLVIIVVFQIPKAYSEEERCWSWDKCIGWFAVTYDCYTKVKPIPIPTEYKWMVHTSCPKLGLTNHTCCHKDRLMQLYKYDNLLRNKYYLSLCPQCLYNVMNFLCDVVCGLEGEKYRALAFTNWQTQREFYDLIVTWRYIKETFQSCQNIRLPHNNMLLMDYMCGQYDHYSCTPMRMFYNLPEWENVTHIRSFYRYIFNVTRDKKQLPYQEKSYSCSAKFQPTEEMPVYGPCKCRDCPGSCPKARNLSINIEEAPEIEPLIELYLIKDKEQFRSIILIFFSIGTILFVTGFLSIYFCRGQDVSLEKFDTWEDGTARTFQPLQASPQMQELANVDQFDDQFGVCFRPFIVRIGAKIANSIEVFFDWWGRLWGRHPGVGLFIGFSIVVALSHGVPNLHVSLDPDEYMVGTNVRSQLERNFFDMHFEPFFRINTLIIHIKKIRYFEYHKSVAARDPRKVFFFGPAFNDSIMLKVRNLTDVIKNISSVGERKLRYRDFCFDPYANSDFVGPLSKSWRNRCAVNSVWAWFQNNETLFEEMRQNRSYLDRIIRCTDYPDHVDCLPQFGTAVHPALVLGGFLSPGSKLTKKADYLKANTHIVQFVFSNNNDPIYQKNVYEWEKEFTVYMTEWVKLYQPPYMDIAFTAHSAQSQESEDSPNKWDLIQDAYFIKFLYLALCWSTFSKVSRLVVDTRFTVAAGAVGIMYSSVTSACGLVAYIDGMGTDVTEKMLPVLMLAIGANNLQMFAGVHWREKMKPDEAVHKHMGRVLAQAGGAMFLTSVLEIIVLFVNRQKRVPSIWWFAMFATIACVVNFIVVMTFGIGMYALDRLRYLNHRFDVLLCIKAKDRPQSVGADGVVYKFFKFGYAPFLMHAFMRCIVMIFFTWWFCISLSVIPQLRVGPTSREISLPKDTYLTKYYDFYDRYVHIGPEVFFVVTEGLEVSHPKWQELIGMQRWSAPNSMANTLYEAYLNSEVTRIALPPVSWFDDFMDWLKVEQCCRVFAENGTFCPNDFKDENGRHPCVSCNVTHHMRRFGSHEGRVFYRSRFRKYVYYFLKDHTSRHCIKGGMAQHARSVNLVVMKQARAVVKTFYYKTHFTSLHSHQDMRMAMFAARTIAANITSMIYGAQSELPSQGYGAPLLMFAISPFFSQFEQYNTVWTQMMAHMGWSLLFVFLVTVVMLGLDVFTALALIIHQLMCVINTMAYLYFSMFPVNAYTCIFITMSQAMFIAFASYTAHAYSTSSGETRVLRAADALTMAGPNVLIGVAFGKLPAVMLFYTNYVVMYRKVGVEIYLYTILVGALHGLIFFPVLLSFIGSARNRQKVIYHMMRKCQEDVCPYIEYDVKSKLYMEPLEVVKKAPPRNVIVAKLETDDYRPIVK